MQSGSYAKPVLLQGVTGSGKIELYLRAIDACLKAGRQALVLVPEISMTPQTIERFMARFPKQVGVVHSKLSIGERYDTWQRARTADFSIAIGPRSALFTPFPNIGVIVVDECHDDSFYQTEMGPLLSCCAGCGRIGAFVQCAGHLRQRHAHGRHGFSRAGTRIGLNWNCLAGYWHTAK